MAIAIYNSMGLYAFCSDGMYEVFVVLLVLLLGKKLLETHGKDCVAGKIARAA
jgi:hypothetical protein